MQILYTFRLAMSIVLVYIFKENIIKKGAFCPNEKGKGDGKKCIQNFATNEETQREDREEKFSVLWFVLL